MFDYKTGPYIDQGGSRLKVWNVQKNNKTKQNKQQQQQQKNVSRLLTFERIETWLKALKMPFDWTSQSDAVRKVFLWYADPMFDLQTVPAGYVRRCSRKIRFANRKYSKM